MTDSFPRQFARTRRFSLGVPRGFRIDRNERQVLFLRSMDGSDPFTCLWRFDLEKASESLLVGPDTLAVDEAVLSDEERARRERARESAGGIVTYDVSDDGEEVVFVLGGSLARHRIDDETTELLDTPSGAYDPRIGSDGAIAYVCGNDLRLYWSGEDEVLLEGSETGAWGTPEFIAAEEMGRSRGHWFSPDGEALLVTRVDDSPSPECVIASPADPTRPARTVHYPFAGTNNAAVELHRVDRQGNTTKIAWAEHGHEYLVDVGWHSEAGAWCLVSTRDQASMSRCTIDCDSGVTTVTQTWTDSCWVEPVPGSPSFAAGNVYAVADVGSQRRLTRDGVVVTTDDLYVRSIVSTDSNRVVFEASPDPTITALYEYRNEEVNPISPVDGVFGGVARGATTVIGGGALDREAATTVLRGIAKIGVIKRVAERPAIELNVSLDVVGERDLRVAVLKPADHDGSKLPVLLDPYGGPHAQRVTRHPAQYYTSQWFADQGFVVIVIDGRGTPGRDPLFERAVRGDLATPVLDDQVDALEVLAAADPVMDLDRVAIRGWSFGGYLAALAVLRRPDVFRAAIAGAPV
ncbi:MAG: DPP IV N-terminal domain-containing protein, partial [Acidobacteria bacterium]|nr:DPP IV N-terminal domain-containing protein [Acidobacteriota bacterium]